MINDFNEKEKDDGKEIDEPVSNFEVVKLSDFPEDYIIKKTEDLEITLPIFEEEIKSFINLKNINEILSDEKYTIKILNKKIKEYSNLKKLFLYFNLDKKVKDKMTSMKNNFILNNNKSKSEALQTSEYGENNNEQNNEIINQDTNKIDNNNVNKEKNPKEYKNEDKPIIEKEEEKIKSKNRTKKKEKMKEENEKPNAKIKDETQEISNKNIIPKESFDNKKQFIKSNNITTPNNYIIVQNETETINNKNDSIVSNNQNEEAEQNNNNNKNKKAPYLTPFTKKRANSYPQLQPFDKKSNEEKLAINEKGLIKKENIKKGTKIKEIREIDLQIKNSKNSSNICKDISDIYYFSNTSLSPLAVNKLNLDDIFFESNILPKLIEKDDEIIEGKDYETKVKKYFKIYLDYCSSQDLNIESNPSTSFNFLYNLAKDHKKVFDNHSSENVVEFDILVKNIKIDAIHNLIKTFKTSVIAYNLKSLKDTENKKYDIIGEVARDLLNQAVNKKKQIRKYIDIILIDKKLRNKDNMKDKLVQNYKSLNLGVENDKILMIFSNGSYIKLKYGYNNKLKINEKNIFENNKIYRNRDIKNLKIFVSILDLLEGHNIPYIIFYIGNDLTNNIDDILINYIKIKETENFFSQIITNEKKIQNNLLKSYYINSITETIKEANINLFKSIIDFLPYEAYFESIIDDIYSKIIDIKISKLFKVQYIFISENENSIKKNDNFKYIMNNKLYYISYNENIFVKKNQIQNINNLIPQNKSQFNFILYNENKVANDLSILIENNADSFDLNSAKVNINILNKIKENILRIVYIKIHNYMSKNINNYSNDKEFLCFNNLFNKIVYDLKKMNFIFYPKKNLNLESNEIKNKINNDYKKTIFTFNYYYHLKNSNLIYKTLSDAFKDDGKINKLILENVKISDEAIDKLYEHYSCIKLYYYLFSSKMIKALDKIILNNK